MPPIVPTHCVRPGRTQLTDSLLRAARLARHVVLGAPKDATVTWAEPIALPHVSLAYADGLNWFKRLRLKLWWGSEAAKALRAGFVVTEASIVQTNRRGPGSTGSGSNPGRCRI